jgi:transcriptional regulator with XRE-family HTH domain
MNFGYDDSQFYVNTAVGRTISLFKNANNLSTQNLADLSNIEIKRLRQLEKGLSSITIEELCRLNEVFDVSNTVFLKIVEELREKWRVKRSAEARN